MKRPRLALKALAVLMVAALAALALAGCTTAQVQSSSSAESASASAAASDASASDSASASSAASAASAASSAASSASASSSSASSASATGSETGAAAASSDQMQTIGNKKVGFMQVPKSWTDRISDIDPRLAESYEMVYYADPSSEYTSYVQQHFAFSKAVQMSVRNTSYKEIADNVINSFKSDSAYGETTYGETTINGRNAIVVTSSAPDDNQLLCTIVIDRDGDEHCAVSLTLNCGASEQQAAEVLAYASTWTV